MCLLECYHTVKPCGGVNMNRTVAFWLQLHHVATANWFEFYSLVSVNLTFWRRLVCSAWQQSPGANPWWAEHSVLWHSRFHQLWPEQHQPLSGRWRSAVDWNRWKNEEWRLSSLPSCDFYPLHRPPEIDCSKFLKLFCLSKYWQDPPRKEPLAGRKSVSSLVKEKTVSGWKQRLKTCSTWTTTRAMISTSLPATLPTEATRWNLSKNRFSPLNNWSRIRRKDLTTWNGSTGVAPLSPQKNPLQRCRRKFHQDGNYFSQVLFGCTRDGDCTEEELSKYGQIYVDFIKSEWTVEKCKYLYWSYPRLKAVCDKYCLSSRHPQLGREDQRLV